MFDDFFSPMHLLILLSIGVVSFLPYWFIFKKAGFSPWLSILTILPIFGTVILYFLAFSKWKVVPVPPYSVTHFPHPPRPPQG